MLGFSFDFLEIFPRILEKMNTKFRMPYENSLETRHFLEQKGNMDH